MMVYYIASATAPVNIATLKYWGKREKELNLPTNSSISVTLSQEDLRTLTSVATGPDLKQDRIWLNGKEEPLVSERMKQCLNELRKLRQKLELEDANLPNCSEWGLHIVSENNFPTAAGLASSASGFAALVKAIAELYKLRFSSWSELSKIARQGSGSACRSLFGGYVAWEMGEKQDGSDSKAVQICPMEHWPQMKAAILVVNASKKDNPSTSGMQLTVKTSDLFQERVNNVVPQRFGSMKDAIELRDWTTFAELTMKDSNSFHATCLDSYPPIFYLNDTSKKIIQLCHAINKFYDEVVVAYTFDAGPNAVLYYLQQNESKLLPFIYKLFDKVQGWETKFSDEDLQEFLKIYESDIHDKLSIELDTGLQRSVKRIILTRVGPGPQSVDRSLIDEITCLPK